jgi:protein SCO1/2
MLTTQLTTVQAAVDPVEKFRILSYSLDPENDSVPVLKSFAEKFRAHDSVWHFLTGPKDSIYKLGMEGFMQTVLNDTGSFINHTQKLILVDKNSMIRGFYNGMDSVEIQLLIRDIHFLLHKEEAYE